MLPCPSLVSLLFTYYQPSEDTGVRRPISYVNFQKRMCSQKDIGTVIVYYSTSNHKVEQQEM